MVMSQFTDFGRAWRRIFHPVRKCRCCGENEKSFLIVFAAHTGKSNYLLITLPCPRA